MAENMMVGSHNHTSKEYSGGYDKITKVCGCGKVLAFGEKCGCKSFTGAAVAAVLEEMSNRHRNGEKMFEHVNDHKNRQNDKKRHKKLDK